MKYRYGGLEILGTEEDFRESSEEVLQLGFEEKKEQTRRKARAAKSYDTDRKVLRNRYDRMKSYYTSHGRGWDVDFEDYCRLWTEAPPWRGARVLDLAKPGIKCRDGTFQCKTILPAGEEIIAAKHLALFLGKREYYKLPTTR